MLHEEVRRYRELSGDTNPNTPISRIGGYLDGYEKALEQTRWVFVSERLPEVGKEYLCCDAYGFIHVGYLSKSLGEWFVNSEALEEVIAWMPLPKPFEPQESERINCKSTKCENCTNHNYCDYEPQEREEV